jgi:CubicO group peptidase (beta-lactamase class C family)
MPLDSLDPAAAGAAIDRVFDGWGPDGPGGGVALLRGGEVLVQRAYGLADLEHRVPVAGDTRFHVASISKTFCAAAVLSLAAEGRLSLDEDVRRWVPDLWAPAPVTLRHLLSMTSGLRDSGELFRLAGVFYDHPRTLDDNLAMLLSQRSLSFPTGQRFIYTNVNFMLASRIAELASGLGFRELLAERFFRPLGLSDTAVKDGPTEFHARLASPYVPLPDGGWAKGLWGFGSLGAGALVSSVPDVARWLGFLRSRPDLLGPMSEPARAADGGRLNYGLGLQVRRWRGLDVLGHGGSHIGYKAYAALVPALDLGLVLLTNREDTDPDRRVREVLDALAGDRMPDEHPRARAKALAHPAATPAIDGLYLDRASGETLTLKAADGAVETSKLGIAHVMVPDGGPDGAGFADPWPILPARIRLEPRPGGGRPRVRLWFGGQTGAFEPVEEPWAPSVADLAACEGRYRSAETRSDVHVRLSGGRLAVALGAPFHGRAELPAEPVAPGIFRLRSDRPGFPFELALRIDPVAGRLVLSSDRLKDAAFDRVEEDA